MKRMGQLIKLKPDAYAEYKKLHADVWPEVLATITRANMRNYTIYHWQGLLFAYFEYIGHDFAADMALIAADPATQSWWQLTDALQEPVQGNSTGSIDGDWWTALEELFHMD